MYKKDLVDRLGKCKAEVKKALAKAQASGGQKDIDFFQNCSAQLVILIHSLAYGHVENLLEIGAIKQMAWCYNNGFLVDGQTEAMMRHMDELHEAERREADERQNVLTAVIQTASDGRINEQVYKADYSRLYITCSMTAKAMHDEFRWMTEKSLASRLGEWLKKHGIKPCFLKKGARGNPAYYQLIHMTDAVFELRGDAVEHGLNSDDVRYPDERLLKDGIMDTLKGCKCVDGNDLR